MDAARLGLLRANPSAVVATDLEGRITAMNPAAEQLLSVPEADALGRTIADAAGPSLATRLAPLFVHTARGGGPHRVVATLPDGRRASLRASLGPLLDDGGRLIGLLLVAEDPDRSDETRRLRAALRRYVGDAVAERIEAHPSFVGVGGKRHVITAVHADLRGYTTLAERLAPEELMDLLVRCHAAAAEALEAQGGTVDRFVGDAILSLWNAPDERPDHARAALRGALAMASATANIDPAAHYGIGVHTGDAVVGNLGTERLLHYTAIGDSVNVAARLQAAAPAGAVLCSAATLERAGDGVSAERLGPLALKGRSEPVEAFRVLGVAETSSP